MVIIPPFQNQIKDTEADIEQVYVAKVVPRMDEQKGSVLLVEEAIERYLKEGVT